MKDKKEHGAPDSIILMASAFTSALVIAGFTALAMGFIGAANYMAS